MLGYGGTSAPSSAAEYTLSAMTADVLSPIAMKDSLVLSDINIATLNLCNPCNPFSTMDSDPYAHRRMSSSAASGVSTDASDNTDATSRTGDKRHRSPDLDIDHDAKRQRPSLSLDPRADDRSVPSSTHSPAADADFAAKQNSVHLPSIFSPLAWG